LLLERDHMIFHAGSPRLLAVGGRRRPLIWE
jgi:hypothetical protein